MHSVKVLELQNVAQTCEKQAKIIKEVEETNLRLRHDHDQMSKNMQKLMRSKELLLGNTS